MQKFLVCILFAVLACAEVVVVIGMRSQHGVGPKILACRLCLLTLRAAWQ